MTTLEPMNDTLPNPFDDYCETPPSGFSAAHNSGEGDPVVTQDLAEGGTNLARDLTANQLRFFIERVARNLAVLDGHPDPDRIIGIDGNPVWLFYGDQAVQYLQDQIIERQLQECRDEHFRLAMGITPREHDDG